MCLTWLDRFQDLNFRLEIQNRVQVWALIKKWIWTFVSFQDYQESTLLSQNCAQLQFKSWKLSSWVDKTGMPIHHTLPLLPTFRVSHIELDNLNWLWHIEMSWSDCIESWVWVWGIYWFLRTDTMKEPKFFYLSCLS